MSEGEDIRKTGEAATPVARLLLAIVEPESGPGGGPAGATTAADRAVFAAEAARLAAALGVPVRLVTWPAGPDVDLEAAATALADIATAAPPAAVLVQDGDAGRQLAPLVARRLGTSAVLGCADAVVGGAEAESCGSGASADRRGHESAAPVGAAPVGAPADPPPRTLTFIKPVYGDWLERTVKAAPGFIPVATLDLGGLEPPEAADSAGAPADVEIVECRPSERVRVHHLETIPPDARSVDLVHAKRIVAAGMGTANEKLLAAVRELAELLEGSVGATRPVVDEGYLPKERLIGQTGRTVAPDLYVALGISGSPHHVAGVRKADRVLAVNRDVRAPIFQFSDVGYVADLETVLPLLVEKIKAWRDGPGSFPPAPAVGAPAGALPGAVGSAPKHAARGEDDGR